VYERVQFGGETLDAALGDCGLTEDETGEDDEEVTAEAP
jgi:hypothetical protein